MSFDEKALRKPGFSEGIWVELADSQKYCLPPVKIRVYPDEKPDGTVETLCRPWYADRMEGEIDVLFGVVESDFMGVWAARMTIATRLLKSNYDLPPGAAATLLSYVPGDEASERRWEYIRAAILGRTLESDEGEGDPKAGTPSGSD